MRYVAAWSFCRYDFGYLLRLLTGKDIPSSEEEFFDLLHTFFPKMYDVKYLMKSCKTLKGGLQEVADDLKVRRYGQQHTAGSDALLTGQAFFKMREVCVPSPPRRHPPPTPCRCACVWALSLMLRKIENLDALRRVCADTITFFLRHRPRRNGRVPRRATHSAPHPAHASHRWPLPSAVHRRCSSKA